MGDLPGESVPEIPDSGAVLDRAVVLVSAGAFSKRRKVEDFHRHGGSLTNPAAAFDN